MCTYLKFGSKHFSSKKNYKLTDKLKKKKKLLGVSKTNVKSLTLQIFNIFLLCIVGSILSKIYMVYALACLCVKHLQKFHVFSF